MSTTQTIPHEQLENENRKLREEVVFLKEQLE